MKFVVGLGNPGQEYAATRHNVGFLAVEELAKRWQVTMWRSRENALVAEYRSAGGQVLIIKPQTYMNLSGAAVGALARWYKTAAEDIIVIYDDVDLPVGGLRIRAKGGTGGHRGVESLLVHLGSDAFTRIRIGISRPPQGMETPEYVLSRFRPDESEQVAASIVKAAEAAEYIISHGITRAMNQFSK